MTKHRPNSPPRGPCWPLRRTDQSVVAFLAIGGLATTIGWWIAAGGLQGRLVQWDEATPQSARFRVDVNRADPAELSQLPGIGPTLAGRIIESRQADGPFQTPEDLLRVRGIGPKRLEDLRPYLRPLSAGEAPANPP